MVSSMRMLGTPGRLRITRNSSTAAKCSAITSSIATADSAIQAGGAGKPAASQNSSATINSTPAKRIRRRSAGASHHSSIEPQRSPSKVQPNFECTRRHCTMRTAPMSRAFPVLLLVSTMCAQPPEVDQALRERITRFYQAHVDRKLIRQADQYVAEDSKDFFYEANKPTYLEFHIDKITYSDDFTKAKAIVNCKMFVMMPGFTDKPMTVPSPSTWKIENGQWVWYVDQKLGRETPFGRMKPAEGAPSAAGVPSLASGPDIQALWKSVRADKSSVSLS